MAKDYFKDYKAIVDTILENMSSKNELDDSRYYTIDILNVDDERAKVMVCDEYRYLMKEAGAWTMVQDAELAEQIA